MCSDDCFQVSQRRPLTQQCHREIDNAANRADQRSARHVRSWLQECKILSLERKQRKKTHNLATSLRLCNIKLDYTSRFMGIDTAQGHANLLCIVPKTLTETSREKRRQKYRDAQSHVFSTFPPLSTRQQRYQGHESFRGIQKKNTVTMKNVCFRQNCHPCVTFDAPKPDARTTFNKDGEKHGQREMLESRDIRQVPNKRRVEVQSQNRNLLIRDVCTCLACPKTFPRSLTTLEETRRCHSYFIRMISRTSSESGSSCNRVSNATDSEGNDLVQVFLIEQRCTSCFPASARLEGRIKSASPSFLDQERFDHDTSRISSFGQTVCQLR